MKNFKTMGSISLSPHHYGNIVMFGENELNVPGFLRRRYCICVRRLLTSPTTARMLATSFRLCLRCSVRCEMREERSAICTSGEPVSEGFRRNFSTASLTARDVRHVRSMRAVRVHVSPALAPSCWPPTFGRRLSEKVRWVDDLGRPAMRHMRRVVHVLDLFSDLFSLCFTRVFGQCIPSDL